MNNTIERKDNLEVRWTRNLISSKRYPEIVQWEEFSNAEIVEELCYTLAYWIRSEQHPLIDDVHWDLKFVGNRPFAVEIDRDVVWSMMKKTQTMLDALEQEEEDERNLHKKGAWGRPKKNANVVLPDRVQEIVGMMEDDEDETDWEFFADGGKTWFVAKLWEDGNIFEVIASEVKYLSPCIEKTEKNQDTISYKDLEILEEE